MGEGISHQAAKRLANQHLRADDTPLVATHATRNRQYSVWIISYGDPAKPGELLVGGGLVVTDEGDVHELSSVPGALDDLMMELRPKRDRSLAGAFEHFRALGGVELDLPERKATPPVEFD